MDSWSATVEETIVTPAHTVQQGNLVDAQGNKFSVQNNKLVPVKTSQEPVQTYGKHGNLNVDNDSSGGPFIKSGRLDFE